MHDVTEANPEEAAWIRRARRGDDQAFALLYRAHAKAIHALAYRLTGNAAAAEDVTQETFLKMFGFLSGLRSDTPLRPWLKRVAANAAIDRLRRDQRFTFDVQEESWAYEGTDAADHAEVPALLRRLPPVARTLVWLHEMEGWSHPEIAVRFGRSQSWSKSILSRALNKLREDIEAGNGHD